MFTMTKKNHIVVVSYKRDLDKKDSDNNLINQYLAFRKVLRRGK